MMKRCSRCVLPESYPFIVFDEGGVCNYCKEHRPRKISPEIDLIEKIKSRRNPDSQYDCLFGLSGGRDSTYALYYAVRKLGLKVLAYTFDNGYVPQTTYENIRNAVGILGVDHVVYKPRWVKLNVKNILVSLLHGPSAPMVSLLCTGCRTGFLVSSNSVARQANCPVSLCSGGEPEKSFAEIMLSGSPHPTRDKLIKGFWREIIHNPYFVFRPSTLSSFGIEFVSRFMGTKRIRYVNFLDLFYYVEWNEEQLVSTITQELKWRIPDGFRTTWRSDCEINLIKQYLYQGLLGFTKNDELMSGLIRTGQITREQALQRLETDNQVSLDYLSRVLGGMGFTIAQMDQAIEKVTSSKA